MTKVGLHLEEEIGQMAWKRTVKKGRGKYIITRDTQAPISPHLDFRELFLYIFFVLKN